nr:phosphotransferase [Paenibacillus soyae]
MLDRFVNEYWPERIGEIRQKEGGWNNSTFVILNGNKRSVLRIYNTHKDRGKIEFEHRVLERLAACPLAFAVPTPIAARNGETIARLDDGSGRYACLFSYIEGAAAVADISDYAWSFGQAAGGLTAALAAIDPAIPPVYPPYYRLKEAYPLCDSDTVLDFCRNPHEPFRHLKGELALLETAYTAAMSSLDGLEKLPHQLVHGDLNGSNLLLDPLSPSKVSALLDFEFCTWDVRAMEAAVILSGMLGTEREREAVRSFCEGYAGKVRLLGEEIEALPILLRLRVVDVFLHFLSRYLHGTDDSVVLVQQIGSQASSLKQLDGKEWLSREIGILV